jgi:Flp pilus assembly protein TadB
MKKDDFDIFKSKPKRTSLFERLKNSAKTRAENTYARRANLKLQLEKAGMRVSSSSVSRVLMVVCVIVNVLLTIYCLGKFYDIWRFNYVFIFVIILVMWAIAFLIVLFVVWLLFYLSLDLAIFKRKQKLEEVLPDFLQLASSNIRAGMTTDQALWFAVRPRFGVLAKEIEEVAKRTMAGEALDEALRHFVGKYDSKVLERSVNILIEGIRAGGEIGDLMSKIALNIQDNNLMKKEMAANVTTYVIFISFATIIAAPFLFGLAYQLISIIQEIFSKVDFSPGANSGFSIAFSKDVISLVDFQIFAVTSLVVTSFFSAIIISTINKGNIKGGFKYIPAFIFSSVLLFFIVMKLFGVFVSGVF